MVPDLNQERQQAHALLDMLPAGKLNAVRSLLEAMVEPLARSLALAPVEEEEIAPETAEALARARASLARGEGIPHEEILREFGLTKSSLFLDDLRDRESAKIECGKAHFKALAVGDQPAEFITARNIDDLMAKC
jgi:hypothetical protein